MLIPRFIAGIFSVGLMIVGTGAVSGQDYPNKTIRSSPPRREAAAISRHVKSRREFRAPWGSRW